MTRECKRPNCTCWPSCEMEEDAPSQPEAPAARQRVSDKEIAFNISLCGYGDDETIPFVGELVLDLRDCRQERDAARARIAELEFALANRNCEEETWNQQYLDETARADSLARENETLRSELAKGERS